MRLRNRLRKVHAYVVLSVSSLFTSRNNPPRHMPVVFHMQARGCHLSLLSVVRLAGPFPCSRRFRIGLEAAAFLLRARNWGRMIARNISPKPGRVESRLVTVRTFTNEPDAYLAKGALEANGIEWPVTIAAVSGHTST